jgi:hypothetical protein
MNQNYNQKDIKEILIQQRIITVLNPLGNSEINLLTYILNICHLNIEQFINFAYTYNHYNNSYIVSLFKTTFLIDYDINIESQHIYLLLTLQNFDALHDYLEKLYLEPISTDTINLFIANVNNLNKIIHMLKYNKNHPMRNILCGIIAKNID